MNSFDIIIKPILSEKSFGGIQMKRYTFKVRGFAKADGRTVYGKWSASKTVKIK